MPQATNVSINLGPGPSTHPFTAVALALLALGTLIRRPLRRSRIATVLYFIALSIGVLRIIEIWSGWRILEDVRLFADVLDQHRLSGSPIIFSWNTAVAVVVAATAGLSRTVRRPLLSQVLAITALAPPLVSVVGYTYGLHAFYGQMSIYTTLILIDICAALLMSVAHRAVVRMVLSNYTAGKMARQMLLAVIIIPFAGGLLVVRMSNLTNDVPVALLVVCVALGNIAVTVRVLMEVEKLDRVRRQRERSSEFEAAHDPLTTLANRRFFELACNNEFARSRRFGTKLSLIMFDIDHFKSVNDKFGHAIGDQVISSVGRVLSHTCREVDVVSRYGGEEFVALLPEISQDGAFTCAERLRCEVGSVIHHDVAGNAFSVTVSAGVAEKRTTDANTEMIVKRADLAMYAAKAAGRNRTCTAP
jgi:diguanylate cyclase (GGDEF)-like protein